MRFRSQPAQDVAVGTRDDEFPEIVLRFVDEPGPEAGVDPPGGHTAARLVELASRLRFVSHAPAPPTAQYPILPRRSCPEEILVTMAGAPNERISPEARRGIAGAGRLRVDPSSLRIGREDLAWSATLRTRPWRRRRATLRLFPSPSTNVTVLTLTPKRPHRIATRSFVRVGWRSMTELRDRLDGRHAVAPALRGR